MGFGLLALALQARRLDHTSMRGLLAPLLVVVPLHVLSLTAKETLSMAIVLGCGAIGASMLIFEQARGWEERG
jgi:hypothetical protein